MANQTISQLPNAGPITGTELVPIVQNGGTYKTTTAAISASPSQTQTFLTVNLSPTLPNSRFLSSGTGIGLVDGGAQSFYRITLNGVSGSLESAGSGIIAKSGGVVVPRTLSTSGSGLSITNPDGVTGNPTFALSGISAAIAALSGTGLVAINNGNAGGVQILGTANQIGVINGNGSGNPTISIIPNPVIPGTGGMTVPSGTIAQRPMGSDGQFRFNFDLNAFEGYSSGSWRVFTQAGGVTSFSAGTTGLTPNTPTSGGVILSGVLNVANGGTGTNTLTGYVKGNGTSAMTASASIPNTDITGLGTMSTQNASSVAITGGSVDGTTVGLTTASTVRGTTITATGQFSGPGTGITGTASGLSIGGSAASATTATTATNVAGGASNQILYQTAASATGFITAPTVSNTYLQWTGTAFTWVTVSTGSGTVTSVNVSGGTTGLTTSGGPITTSGTITLSGTLNVANGGTGATTLTGYVYGNGTGAMTASTTIPNTAITGLGTLSTQNANNVAITGGSIDGTTVGATTATTVRGTTITATSQFSGPGTGLTGTASGLSIGGSAASATTATTATNIAGGSAGAIAYNSGSNTTTFLSLGTTNYVLTAGATAPQYVAQSTLSVGSAANTSITADSTNATNYLTFVSNTTGSLPQLVNSGIACNPSTGKITAGIAGGTF